jgi:hypothetical protein
VTPICAPYKRIGSPVISPGVFGDLEAFLKASVAKLHDGNVANTTRFQMQLATQTSDLGFVENRIFSAFPAIENLSWDTFVLSGLVSKRKFKAWPTERRLRELLIRAQIQVDIDEQRLPVLHRLAVEKGTDDPGAITWVRNSLIHPKNRMTSCIHGSPWWSRPGSRAVSTSAFSCCTLSAIRVAIWAQSLPTGG